MTTFTAMSINTMTMSEIDPSLKEAIEKLIEEHVPKENKESTAVLQRIEALAQELRHQRELIQNGFDMANKRFEAIDKRIEETQRNSDKRFEEVLHYSDKRFEDMKHYSDKHFEDMKHYTDKHFEAMNKRFEDMNRRLEDMKHYSDKHFEAMNKRFEDMNKRFEDMNKRFEDMNKRFNTLQWMIGIGFTAITLLMAFFRFYAASSG